MAGYFTRRVVATVLALNVDARQLQAQDLLGLLGTQVPFQVQELLVHAARNAAHQEIESRPSTRASFGTRSTAGASSLGFAQTLSTGVLIASGSPLRSVIVPRWADVIFSVRRWRVSACSFRKSLLKTCRCTARATSAARREHEEHVIPASPCLRISPCSLAVLSRRRVSWTLNDVDFRGLRSRQRQFSSLSPPVRYAHALPRYSARSATGPIRC